MLRSFRSKLSSWLMLLFLVLAVGAIVITGFGTGGMGGLPSGGGTADAGDTLVTVGDEEIKAGELDALIRRRLRDAQRENPEVDMAQFLNAGAYEALLDQMIVGRALWQYGRDHGLVVSDRMIDRLIASVPAFHNLAGQFDMQTFRQVIGQQNLTEQQVRQDVANLLMQRQLQVPIGLQAGAPEAMTLQYASLMLERRSGAVGRIPNEALAQGIAPSDAEIARYYAQNRARYTVPERRVLRYAVFGREQVAANARATDPEIAAYYRQNAARYAGSETRTLQQVVLRDEAAARTFVTRAGGGANFVQAATQAGFAPADIALGPQRKEQVANLANAAVADAVFAASQGAMVGPIRSPLGWHVLRVESINRAAARPLEAVRAEIVTAIEARKTADALSALGGRLEERISQGSSFEEVVRAEHLTVVETPPLTAQGTAPGVQWQGPPEIQALVRSAYLADPEDPEPIIETLTANERFALLSVARVIPAAVPPLAQIREQVRGDIVRQQAAQRARALGDRIVARINGGVPIARAFAEAGVRLPAPEPFNARRIDLARRGAQIPPPAIAFFSIPPGRAKAMAGRDAVYIVNPQQRTPGQASCPAGQTATGADAPEGCQAVQLARGELGQVGGELTEQFARAAQNAVEVRRNEDAIRRARQQLQAAGR